MIEKLVRCTQCNKVIPQFGPFGDFGESSLLPGVEWSSEDMDEQREFSRCHQGHLLEELLVDRETFVSDKPSYEPMKVSYVEACNGKQRFLIKRTRATFDRPACYELVPGRIRVADVSLEIQEDELQKQISWLNGSLPLPSEKVKKFIEAFREEVKSVSAEHWDEDIERMLPGETSLLAYGSFSENRWGKVLERCEKNNFRRSELQWIEKFIHEHSEPGDVLALQIKKKVSISAPENKLPL